jgi:hypothetical protein
MVTAANRWAGAQHRYAAINALRRFVFMNIPPFFTKAVESPSTLARIDPPPLVRIDPLLT